MSAQRDIVFDTESLHAALAATENARAAYENLRNEFAGDVKITKVMGILVSEAESNINFLKEMISLLEP